MRLPRYAWGILGCLILTAESVSAQPVPSREPSSTHVFPAGGRRGSIVQVLVGGECIPPETGFRIYGGGVTGPERLGSKVFSSKRLEPSPRRDPREIPICYPKEWQASVEIASDAALGPRSWRLTCSRGGTGSRPFIVGDLPEFIENESNSVPERAERLVLPVTVNGRIAGESDLDYFAFKAARGDLVACDMVAGRIGSPLDAVVEFTDGAGGRVETTELRIGSDPIVAFRAPSTGEYRMLVSNVGFHGSPAHVYRATLFTIDDLSDVALPDVWSRLLERGLIPSIACGVNTEPSSAPTAAAGPLTNLPINVRGQFRAASESRAVRVRAVRDEVLEITCHAIPHGVASLPVVTVLDMAGKSVAECRSTGSPSRDCRIDWRAALDGEYQILVSDGWQGGSPARAVVYELAVRRAAADFALTLKSDFANVVQGAKFELEVKADRLGGFAGPIELVAVGLLADVRAEPANIAENQNAGKITIVAQEKARPNDVEFRILGRAKLGDVVVERMATAPHLGRDLHGVAIGAPESTSCFLTVQHKPVFRLFCNEAYQYAYRGTIYPYAMQVERLGDFDGEITVQLGDRQNRDLDGIDFFEVTIPAGASETRVPIYLPESMHINVLSQSQIYAQAHAFFTDQWGQRQATLVVSEKRNMIRTMPTVAKLQSVERELAARRGTTVVCRLVLDRTSNFTGPVEVELVDPPGSAGFAAATGRIEAGAQEVDMAVRVPLDRDAASDPVLRFQARGQLTGDVTVISETKIPLRIVD